jgi:hypothetical protein
MSLALPFPKLSANKIMPPALNVIDELSVILMAPPTKPLSFMKFIVDPKKLTVDPLKFQAGLKT